MTASIQPETKSPSRRALLAGALGGIGALAATVIGRASPVRGADGQAVVVGGEYTAFSPTGINRSEGVTLYGNSDSGTGVSGASLGGNGVLGNSQSGIGVTGFSNSNVGVFAWSSSSDAVRASTGSGIGVSASNSATNLPASIGHSWGNSTGVLGASTGVESPPTARAKTGVYGYANQDNTASGVYGLSPLGVGVRGHSASGYAGYFEGRVYTNAFYELGEVVNPAPPLANRARLFVRDNGAGKTQLCVRFRTGGVHIIKTEL